MRVKIKASAPAFLAGYVFTAYVASLLSVALGWRVAFGYHEEFNLDQLITLSWIPVAQLTVISLGSYVSSKSKRLPTVQARGSWYSPHLVTTSIFAFFFYIVFSGLIQERELNYTGEILRVLDKKGLHLLLVIFSGLSILNVHKRRLGVISSVLIFSSSTVIALVDGSRAAILPAVLFIIYSSFAKRWVLMSTSILCLLILLGVISGGRVLTTQLDWSLQGLSIGTLTNIDLNYFFGFSYLHLFYSNINFTGEISAQDIVYSITPIPSSYHPIPANPNLWRIDIYRPLGAQAETYNNSILTFLALNFVFGFLASRISKIYNPVWKGLFTVLVLFAFAASFQYNLRSIQWGLWLTTVGLILFKHEGREDQSEIRLRYINSKSGKN